MNSSQNWRGVLEQHRIFGASYSSTFGPCKMAPGVRSLNCAGPGTASKSLPEVAQGWRKRPVGRARGAFA
eukprot:6397165-Alexandrium_andersonii.AAC.1